MAQRSTLRASDDDRDKIADRLRKAAAEGRIHAHELEERLARALRARTYGELDDVVSDLPRDRVARRSRGSVVREHPGLALAVAPVAVLIAVVVVAVIAAVIAGIAALWSLWWVAMMLWWFSGHRHGGHRRGGGRGRRGGPPFIGGPRQFQRY